MAISFSSDIFTTNENAGLMLSGAAAISRGAFEAGVGLVLTYPGSPVVESFEVFAHEKSGLGDRARIVINEHVALHQALGFSLAGGRSLVIMKHVGLNVAADPLHYSGYTGTKGGMVILVGSDPGGTCSTSEFDCRRYALHAHLPILEPGDFQEALDMTRNAFDLSEEIALPVMIFIPSRFCYGMGTVSTQIPRKPVLGGSFQHTDNLTCIGPRISSMHQKLLGKVEALRNDPRDGKHINIPSDKRWLLPCTNLIVTSGIYTDFVREALEHIGAQETVSVFAPSMTYPLGQRSFLDAIEKTGCKKLLFVEDLEGLLELQACEIIAHEGLSLEIHGQDLLPPWGVLSFQRVLETLCKFLDCAISNKEVKNLTPVVREGTFCPGCSHRAFFYTLQDLLQKNDIIGGDIGCSSLPPHFSDWLTCMNSGTSIASGVTLSLDGSPRVISIIGDSTLFHSGLQTIIECAQRNSNQICFVLDNGWTAMTGHQITPGTKRRLDGTSVDNAVDLATLLKSCGVRTIRRADPLKVSQLRRVMIELFATEGFACVLVEHECRLQEIRRGEKKRWKEQYAVIEDNCRRCNRCYSLLTCPAIMKNSVDEIVIDTDVCVGCGVCREICPNGAITLLRSIDEEKDNDS